MTRSPETSPTTPTVDVSVSSILSWRPCWKVSSFRQNRFLVDWSGNTAIGIGKEANEDSLTVFGCQEGWPEPKALAASESIEDDGIVFLVSDGMGGANGGAVASHLVTRELSRFLPAMIGDFTQAGSLEPTILEAILATHDYVSEVGNGRIELLGMGATVVAAMFFRGEVHFGHVGDSRLYRFRGGELQQLTHDHSYVGRLQETGELSEQEAREHPRRNLLYQAMGGRCSEIEPQVSSTDLEVGDWFLICSDGVIDGLWDRDLLEAFTNAESLKVPPEDVGSQLLDWACEQSGTDDTTLFVIHVEEDRASEEVESRSS